MCYPADVRCALPFALAGLVALGSCSVETRTDGTNFGCDARHACPPNYVCTGAGFCVRPDWRCGMVNVLYDDFEDGVVSWAWEASVAQDGATLAEEGGHAVLTPAADSASPSTAYYESIEWYAWQDSQVFIEVPQSVGVAGSRAFLALVFDGDDTISIVQEADQLFFRWQTGGAETTLGSIQYDPALHRWWQLRSANGQTRWETSPDALDWTTRQEMQLQPPSLARTRFGASADAGVSDPGAAHFDNLNGGVALGHTCRAQDIDEDFEGGGKDGWRRSYDQGGASHDLADGAAVVTLSDTDASESAFVTSEAYTLVDNGVSIQVTDVPAATAGVSTWLRAVARDGNAFLGIRLEEDTLYFEQSPGGTTAIMGSVLYDPQQHRYWGIGDRGGEVHWSTSPDGQDWTTQVTAAEPFRLDALAIEFGATGDVAPSGSTVARFDDVH